MDWEKREQANQIIREKLIERLEAGRIPLEALMGRSGEEESKLHSNVTGEGDHES